MSTDVAKLIDKVIGIEGKYSNNPADRGGETMWGVTEFVARAFGYHGEMANMPRDTAVQIYVTRYWVQPRFYYVDALDPKLAARLFDIGINMGVGIASGFVQRALNVLNRDATDWPDLHVDHIIGAITIAAMKTLFRVRGQAGHDVLLNMVIGQQTMRYIEIAETRPVQEQFEFGWELNRALPSAT